MKSSSGQAASQVSYGVSYNLEYLFGGPYNKDSSILGSILGSPYFGKLPYGAIASAATAETLGLEKQGTTRVAVGTGANSA